MIYLKKVFLLFYLIIFLLPQAGANTDNSLTYSLYNSISGKSFFGLASMYNRTYYYIISPTDITPLEHEKQYTLTKNQLLVKVHRDKLALLKADNLKFYFSEIEKDDGYILNNIMKLDWIYTTTSGDDVVNVVVPLEKSEWRYTTIDEIEAILVQLEKTRYAHLWYPIAWLSKGFEGIFLAIHSLHAYGWGISILVFALLFKIFMFPSGQFLQRIQNSIAKTQMLLEPELKAIKENFKGQEAHEKFMLAHKKLGVTPFYTLKAMPLAFLPLPLLIGISNALGEMDQLAGQSFLWINDLSLPDALFNLPFEIPFLGSTFNLLPILMTVFTGMSAITYKNKELTTLALRKQKRKLYWMAFAFLVLFYPFPSGMVLYWTYAMGLYFLQQIIVQKYLK